MERFSIGDVAKRAGIQPSAIRYYETAGVLPEPHRVNGRRQYGGDTLIRLRVVRMAREAGFTIAEIKALFHSFPEDTAASLRWRALAGQKIAEMNTVIAQAERMRAVLEESMRCECLTFDGCALIGWSDPTGPSPDGKLPN
ncbi:MAG: MerR family transcriptional regulator [Thermomicrobiales bacterium]